MRMWPLPILLVTGLALGCGNRNAGTVSGRVTLDRKPLENARVTFQPFGGTAYTGVGSYGTTNANGEYTLSFIDGKGAGAAVGKHQVRITVVSPDNDTKDDRPRRGFVQPVPEKYNFKSTLEADVHPGANENVNFDLTTK
jgi:hypothetical protein